MCRALEARHLVGAGGRFVSCGLSRSVRNRALHPGVVAAERGQCAHAVLAGLGGGAVALAVIAWLMLRYGVRLPIGLFFTVCSLLMALLADRVYRPRHQSAAGSRRCCGESGDGIQRFGARFLSDTADDCRTGSSAADHCRAVLLVERPQRAQRRRLAAGASCRHFCRPIELKPWPPCL